MPSRLMPIAMIAILAVSFMWITRDPEAPTEAFDLPIFERPGASRKLAAPQTGID